MVALFARRVAVYPGDGLGEQRAATHACASTSRARAGRWSTCAACSARRSTRRPRGAGASRSPRCSTARAPPARPRLAERVRRRPMTSAELMAEHGSPLWLVDLDRVRARLREFRARVDARVARRRGRLLLQDQPAAGHPARAGRRGRGARGRLRGRVRAGARRHRRGGARRDRQRPGQARCAARARGGRRRAGRRRLRARARARPRAPASSASGLRVALPGIGVEPTRFGIAPGAVPEAAARARALGLELEALSAHLVSTGFDRPLVGRAAPRRGDHRAVAARARRPRARRPRAWRGWPSTLGVAAVDLGGGFPAAPAVAAHAAAVADALRASGFAGRLILEPGRALVTDAVALAFSVVAVKELDDGTRCVVVDAGTNLLPGALWSWPRDRGASARDERPTSPGARQRAAVPERRRPAPGGRAARRGSRATRCSCATPAPISRRNRRASATCAPRCSPTTTAAGGSASGVRHSTTCWPATTTWPSPARPAPEEERP